jgi:hypothetical protein
MNISQKTTHMDNMENDTINNNEIIAALKRSGYLLENRILSQFLKRKITAEANHKIIFENDENKSREIDVIATKFIDTIQLNDNDSISLCAHFIVECINNSQPLGLFENLGDWDEPSSDWIFTITNGDMEMAEIIGITFPRAIYDYEIERNNSNPAKQYCTFQKKKGDHKKDQWMAYHPDDFHKTLSKLVDASQLSATSLHERWAGRQPQILRIDTFIPIIVLQNELFKIIQKSDKETEIELLNAKHQRLKSSSEESNNRNISIDIVQEDFFNTYLEMKIEGLETIFKLLKNGIK